MKFCIIFVLFFTISVSFVVAASPTVKLDDIYAEWRKEIQVFEDKRSPQGIFLGYNMWDIKYFQKLDIFSKMVLSDNKDMTLFLVEKMKIGLQGDEFLAFIICRRENIDIKKILLNADNNLWALPREIINLEYN